MRSWTFPKDYTILSVMNEIEQYYLDLRMDSSLYNHRALSPED